MLGEGVHALSEQQHRGKPYTAEGLSRKIFPQKFFVLNRQTFECSYVFTRGKSVNRLILCVFRDPCGCKMLTGAKP